jgi:fluoroacetyl-CoA thioesterase
MLKEGLSHTSTLTVDSGNTAAALGSGDMDVLATPAMTAIMENAAMLAVAGELPEGSTTVGIHIDVLHLHPSPLHAIVEAKATLQRIEGRKLYFDIVAKQGEEVVGEGSHQRFIVDRERFLSKLRG